ncbi:hypothetical protein K435DRAFT_142889 [Dendrothele bispora CBS 962.96]|uniref:Uncharacterized protein n=1 Tax=Dendrothele bispora (strain CBS 962.96) TaxID=1314807 RepID=A0A4S8LZS0_DENBC|nr:hypothetical protein K435DRAFT_142889 [Dendrothele bispora CBS 962.96]
MANDLYFFASWIRALVLPSLSPSSFPPFFFTIRDSDKRSWALVAYIYIIPSIHTSVYLIHIQHTDIQIYAVWTSSIHTPYHL